MVDAGQVRRQRRRAGLGDSVYGRKDGVFVGKIVCVGTCRIPDDCIDSKRYPLFMAREVMRQLIDNLCVTSAVHPGALS